MSQHVENSSDGIHSISRKSWIKKLFYSSKRRPFKKVKGKPNKLLKCYFNPISCFWKNYLHFEIKISHDFIQVKNVSFCMYNLTCSKYINKIHVHIRCWLVSNLYFNSSKTILKKCLLLINLNYRFNIDSWANKVDVVQPYCEVFSFAHKLYRLGKSSLNVI